MKNTLKLILKGILLYSSILFWLFFICAVDSILEQGQFGIFTLIGIIDALLLNRCITVNEFETLLFYKHQDENS